MDKKPTMTVSASVTIGIDDQTITLTFEQARTLYEILKKLLNVQEMNVLDKFREKPEVKWDTRATVVWDKDRLTSNDENPGLSDWDRMFAAKHGDEDGNDG